MKKPAGLGPYSYLDPIAGGAGSAVAAGGGRDGAIFKVACAPDRSWLRRGPDVLNYALASLLVVALVLAVASGARFYLVSWPGERVVGNLRRDLFGTCCVLGPRGSRSNARATS